MKRTAILVAILLGTVICPAQVVAPTALAYAWPVVTSTGQVGSHLLFSNVNVPRPSNYSIDWADTGTAPSACTFNVQGSYDGTAWFNLNGATPLVCTASGYQPVQMAPVFRLRINIVTYTAGDGTTSVVFHYAGGR